MGGGMLVGGESLTVTTGQDKSVVFQHNRARKGGGGVSFMGRVKLGGEGTTRVQGNHAQNGGGFYGFSSFARLEAASEHALVIEDNVASHDGGGISLARGAQFSLGIPACSPECTSAMRGNGKCDFGYSLISQTLSCARQAVRITTLCISSTQVFLPG